MIDKDCVSLQVWRRDGEEDGGARCRFVVVARTVAADVV